MLDHRAVMFPYPTHFTARIAFLLLLVTCVDCRTAPNDRVRVTAEASPTADFSQYRTYAWMTEPTATAQDQRTPETLRDWRIRNAVDAQLAARGYVKQAVHRPDFLADYHTERKERTTDSIGDYVRYRQGGGQAEIFDTYVLGYDEGVLTVEIFDAQTRDLAWRASATSIVNPGDEQGRIAEAVRRIFGRFPSF